MASKATQGSVERANSNSRDMLAGWLSDNDKQDWSGLAQHLRLEHRLKSAARNYWESWVAALTSWRPSPIIAEEDPTAPQHYLASSTESVSLAEAMKKNASGEQWLYVAAMQFSISKKRTLTGPSVKAKLKCNHRCHSSVACPSKRMHIGKYIIS